LAMFARRRPRSRLARWRHRRGSWLRHSPVSKRAQLSRRRVRPEALSEPADHDSARPCRCPCISGIGLSPLRNRSHSSNRHDYCMRVLEADICLLDLIRYSPLHEGRTRHRLWCTICSIEAWLTEQMYRYILVRSPGRCLHIASQQARRFRCSPSPPRPLSRERAPVWRRVLRQTRSHVSIQKDASSSCSTPRAMDKSQLPQMPVS
jgi:hypothetical protein